MAKDLLSVGLDALRAGAASAGSAALKTAAKSVEFLPSGDMRQDPNGTIVYRLSDLDVERARQVLSGALKPSAGRPLVKIERIEEAILPAVLGRWGLHLAAGVAAVFLLGRLSK